MKKLLLKLSGYLPCRLIYEDGQGGGRPYLQRYYVCSIFGLRVYLHRFIGSDPDRGLHSHPWSWAISLILSGHYYEERFTGDLIKQDIRKVSRFNFLVGESHHRVILPRDFLMSLTAEERAYEHEIEAAPAECWSLFIHRAGSKRRWGFMRPAAPHPNVPLAEARHNNEFIFALYVYPGGVQNFGEWWKTAPLGRDISNR